MLQNLNLRYDDSSNSSDSFLTTQSDIGQDIFNNMFSMVGFMKYVFRSSE